MVENKNFSLVSPESLSGALITLYKQLPGDLEFSTQDEFGIPSPEDPAFEYMEKRYNSEYKKTVMGMLDRLLGIAPITPSFRRYIGIGFDEWYVMGTLEHELGEAGRSGLIENITRDGGIFNPEIVKEIERKEYLGLVRIHLNAPSVGANILRRYGIESELEGEEDLDLQIWRQEFITHYGEEP